MAQSDSDFGELRIVSKSIGFLALLTGFLYIRVIFGEGIPTVGIGSIKQGGLLVFVLLVSATLGLLLAWRWEGAGSLIAILSALILAGVVYFTAARNRMVAAFVYSSPFLVAGGLFLACWWRRRLRAIA
ncbi:MAG TPA: hypothetical protein VE553_03885 [Candidatus Binatia bacterium]|nr:hypothetical protein [Candidatus Binatia bacterium]